MKLAQYILTARNPAGKEVTFRIDVKRSQYGNVFALVEFLPRRGRGRYVGRINMSAAKCRDSVEPSHATAVDRKTLDIARWAVFNGAPWYEGFRGDLPDGYTIDLDVIDLAEVS